MGFFSFCTTRFRVKLYITWSCGSYTCQIFFNKIEKYPPICEKLLYIIFGGQNFSVAYVSLIRVKTVKNRDAAWQSAQFLHIINL